MYERTGQRRTEANHTPVCKNLIKIAVSDNSQGTELSHSIFSLHHSIFQEKSTLTMKPTSHPSMALFRGWDTPTHYVWSPFVTKVEFRLRLSALPYTSLVGSPRTAPRGKIPYLSLSAPSSNTPTEWLSDSTLIFRTLIDRGAIPDLNATLSPTQKAHDLAIRALLEEKLYFTQGRERWVQNYYTMRDHTLWSIPYPLRVVIGNLAYRANLRKFYDHGAGRFSDDETRAFVKEIWSGVGALLEESKRNVKGDVCFWVLGGKEPTEADATVFGFAVSTLVCDAAPESRELVKMEFPVVVEYAERIHRRWFAEYEMW
ncbi:hypothetical protein BU23DRAFT_551665 [Bimuria novae-zelandiae CBS 107.79]|uniref:Thioredoxin-like fold domain-containing protein n=1 Tax=Bimuria novae-zelandiae CBS 107.79 TaxID=1447943 RepID=A0A6A5VG95_9PLEO|nr:hypothetical protein BU23DRAFT_551665 [Bimuria novae-zelandiae CBS 107.79]